MLRADVASPARTESQEASVSARLSGRGLPKWPVASLCRTQPRLQSPGSGGCGARDAPPGGARPPAVFLGARPQHQRLCPPQGARCRLHLSPLQGDEPVMGVRGATCEGICAILWGSSGHGGRSEGTSLRFPLPPAASRLRQNIVRRLRGSSSGILV